MNDSSTMYLGFGTAGISSLSSRGGAIRLLRVAFDGGIRHFDTAPLYGKGYAEQILGDFIARRRSALSIATKFGLGGDGSLPLPASLALPLNYYRKKFKGMPITLPPAEPAEAAPLSFRRIDLASVRQSLATSLKRLRTDYIDYYLLHEALPGFLDEAVLPFLLSKKEQGVIRHIGIATDGYNLNSLAADEIASWDVLQYEAGPWQDVLRNRFPKKLHFVHSVLKYIHRQPPPSAVSAEDWAGLLLARQAANLQADRLIFSTRDRRRLQKNISIFHRETT
jgi:aryl-alcohol dehydrogenase-like predicted oxidoreductase